MDIKEYKKLKKNNKYKNIKVNVDGILFDSRKEARYYIYLKKLKKSGIVKDFKRQVSFEIQPPFIHKNRKIRSIKYVLDFKVVYSDGHIEYVDVKSSRKFQDPIYRLKKKMFHYKYRDIEIKEVTEVPSFNI